MSNGAWIDDPEDVQQPSARWNEPRLSVMWPFLDKQVRSINRGLVVNYVIVINVNNAVCSFVGLPARRLCACTAISSHHLFDCALYDNALPLTAAAKNTLRPVY